MVATTKSQVDDIKNLALYPLVWYFFAFSEKTCYSNEYIFYIIKKYRF